MTPPSPWVPGDTTQSMSAWWHHPVHECMVTPHTLQVPGDTTQSMSAWWHHPVHISVWVPNDTYHHTCHVTLGVGPTQTPFQAYQDMTTVLFLSYCCLEGRQSVGTLAWGYLVGRYWFIWTNRCIWSQTVHHIAPKGLSLLWLCAWYFKVWWLLTCARLPYCMIQNLWSIHRSP